MSLSTFAHAEITAQQLKDWAGGSDQKIKASEQRLKASDLSSTFYKTAKIKRRVYYRTPDGGVLIGFMLPNGTVAPAYFGEMKKEQAGCLASDGKVYPATWRNDELICDLPQVGIVEIKKENYTVDLNEVIADQKQQLKGEKYAAKDQAEQPSKKNEYLKTATDVSVDRPSVVSHPQIRKGHNVRKSDYMTAINTVSVPSTFYTMQADQKTFGIPFGRWFKARLTREVTNADNGQIELILDETVVGKKRDLITGTVFFANKNYNFTTGRMDLTINRAITPEDKKIRIAAVVYDENKISGLSGTLVRDRPVEMKSMMNQSAIKLASDVLESATQHVPSDSIEDFADNIIANERRFLVGVPHALIKVKPQTAYVRVIESF